MDFSPTRFIFGLRAIQMACGVWGPGTAVQLSPKILGLNTGNLGLFWAVPPPGLIFGLLLVHVCCLCVIENMNNMLVVCKLC